MLMADNNVGGVGMAQGHVVGIMRVVDGGPRESRPEAILDVASSLSFGDVMLLEVH
jgi:hypothetical protein